MLFLFVLLFSLHMGEALGAQTEIRKISETCFFLFFKIFYVSIFMLNLPAKDMLMTVLMR